MLLIFQKQQQHVHTGVLVWATLLEVQQSDPSILPCFLIHFLTFFLPCHSVLFFSYILTALTDTVTGIGMAASRNSTVISFFASSTRTIFPFSPLKGPPVTSTTSPTSSFISLFSAIKNLSRSFMATFLFISPRTCGTLLTLASMSSASPSMNM